ncbi:hypothetical protein SHM7688_00550 [Shimia marina]|uniref:Uncharacterized protein n=1 Tax=Shimia marina TaxID=321267 RepID=A0A0P1FCG9_9RHOB|nr:hypothetical protein SHM7688_00550 [Shimia marina]
MARIFQRLPAHLKKLTMLRIHDCRLFGREPKKLRIKIGKPIQHGGGRHIVAMGHLGAAFALGKQILFGEVADRADALSQIVPILFNPGRARQMGGHANNRNIGFTDLLIQRLTHHIYLFFHYTLFP